MKSALKLHPILCMYWTGLKHETVTVFTSLLQSRNIDSSRISSVCVYLLCRL